MSYLADLANTEQFSAKISPTQSWAKRNRQILAGAALAVVLAGGYGTWKAQGSEPQTPPAAQAIPVTVETVAPRDVRLWQEFSGRMTAVDSADIRPEVSGRITQILFKDGQTVNAGDVLLVIDPRPYEAAVASAKAALATAEVNQKLAAVEMDRAVRLKQAGAIAQDLYDQRNDAQGVADAAIKSAQAALDQAELNVDHAYVKAPISGRVSRAEIELGNLVQATANPPVLTSIVSNDGIYADFDVDEQTYLDSIRSHAATATAEQKIPVELTLPGDTRVYRGSIESFDNQINTGTGTIRARARFDNSDGALVPGMFVNVRLAAAANSKVLLVPDEAIGSDQSKRFVYVVGKGSKAEFREVTLGQEANGERVVLSGLKSGDRIITDDLQRVAPGAVVAAQRESYRKFASR